MALVRNNINLSLGACGVSSSHLKIIDFSQLVYEQYLGRFPFSSTLSFSIKSSLINLFIITSTHYIFIFQYRMIIVRRECLWAPILPVLGAPCSILRAVPTHTMCLIRAISSSRQLFSSHRIARALTSYSFSKVESLDNRLSTLRIFH